jgi:hypothetical protein
MNLRRALLPQFILDLLSAPPRRGEGLNLWLYRVARVLHPYREPAELIELLRATTAGEPIKHGEIERAVKRSKATAWHPGQPPLPLAPAWPKVNLEQRDAVIASGPDLVDLWEISPVRFEDSNPHTEEIIDALFPGDPLLCAGRSNSDFDTRLRSEWRGTLATLQFIVPNPMTAPTGLTQDGKESAHALSNTGPRWYLVIEQDRGTVDEQAAVLYHLAQQAPLALAVHSGSKSLHGWFYCLGQIGERLRIFMRDAATLGADPATWSRVQFVRMPGGRRADGEHQVVYFFYPGVVK